MIRMAALLTCLALAGCGTAPAHQSRAVKLGEEVTLAPGETAVVRAAKLAVRFVAVTDDSRCPRDTTCIWAGEVKVALEFSGLEGTLPVELTEGKSANYGIYMATLLRVEPQPASNVRISAQGYRATLKIDQAVIVTRDGR